MINSPTWYDEWQKKMSFWLSPVWVVFIASILLSIIALQKGTINRDGMLYVETARVYLEQGLPASMVIYSWPFLSVLMAHVSKITGLGLESSGYILNALFMAGASALLVACALRLYPEQIWYVCLAILALPGFNGYRDELLREYGSWFFVMLAFWLALRWADAPRWSIALVIHLSIAVAAMFRPEALALLVALLFWQIFDAPKGNRERRLLMIGGPLLIGFATLMVLHANEQLAFTRLAADFNRFSLERFDAKALAIAPVFIDYARDQAHTILFFGSIAIVPMRFFGKMGPFIVPLLYVLSSHSPLEVIKSSRFFSWAFLIHFLIITVFALDMQFVSGRYIAPLVLFVAPITGYGLWLLVERFPRWKLLMVFMTLAIMISNVISLGPGKHHFVEAGEWLAKHAEDSPRVYIESARAAYYAGWRYSSRPSPSDRSALAGTFSSDKYDLVVLEVSTNKSDVLPWLEREGLRELIRFSNSDKEAVIVAEPQSMQSKKNLENH